MGVLSDIFNHVKSCFNAITMNWVITVNVKDVPSIYLTASMYVASIQHVVFGKAALHKVVNGECVTF